MSAARGNTLELEATGHRSRAPSINRTAVSDGPVEIHAPAECRVVFIQGAAVEFTGSDGDSRRNGFRCGSTEACEDQSLAGGVIDRPRFDHLAVFDRRT